MVTVYLRYERVRAGRQGSRPKPEPSSAAAAWASSSAAARTSSAAPSFAVDVGSFAAAPHSTYHSRCSSLRCAHNLLFSFSRASRALLSSFSVRSSLRCPPSSSLRGLSPPSSSPSLLIYTKLPYLLGVTG
ncbi:hypothetical protein Syun_000588 [Stephania yunnanensis]|uniref:Uncharacterized protein n=1 Tax=Stephania yunnanensis TaxID=152371 RepID=A0AAP0LC93_9MAGN